MPTNLYGPGDYYHLTNSYELPALIRRFHEAKERARETFWEMVSLMREFWYVHDLGKACVIALKRWSALAVDALTDNQGKLLAFLNAGTGVDLTIKVLADQSVGIVGFEGAIQWNTSKPDGTPKK